MTRQLLILLDKTVVRFLFWPLVGWARLRRSGEGRPTAPREGASFLVIRPGGLGDGIMAVPTLRALRRAHPRAHLTVACVRKNRRALELLPFHDDLIVIDDPRHTLEVFRRRYDAVFDLEPFRRLSSVVAFLSCAPVRVGFDTNVRRLLYTHLVTYQNDRAFEAANCVRQLHAIGLHVPDEESGDLHFDLPEEPRAKGREILHAHGVDPHGGPLVAVAPGVLKPHHRWIMAEWADLVETILADDPEVTVLLVGGPGDRPDADEVVGHLGENRRVVDLVGRTSYVESLAVFEHCRVLLACDGGIVYMAAAMGCATVSLWGPGVMERFKPPGERHVGVRKGYPCIPCVTWDRLGEFPRCPYGRKCYGDLTAADAFEAYHRAVAETPGFPAPSSS